MHIMRFSLIGTATVVLAGMLAAGLADPASAARAKKTDALQKYTAPDRQLESRGYRAKKHSAQHHEEQAKAPPDRQLESRGYRRHKEPAVQ